MHHGAGPGTLIIAERALPDRGGLAVASSPIAAHAAARAPGRVHLLALSSDAPPGGRAARRQQHEAGDVALHLVGPLPSQGDTLMALTDHALELIDAHALDLVHGVYATRAGYVATIAAAARGLPSIVSLRGNDLDRGLFRAGELPFLQHALTRASFVTGVSRALCERASRVFGRPVAHITNSVDATVFKPETRDNSLVASLGLAGATVIGFAGELREKKGMRYLLPAFAEVCRRRDAHLLLIGGVRRDAEEALAAFARAAPEAHARIHALDYARKPARLCGLLALCDLMVFPSLQEGTPNAVLEAMAAERLVLATAVGGHLDLITHGEHGALLPLDELDRLPGAIEEMLELPEETRSRMTAAARARVIAAHAPADEQAAYAELYARARGATRAS
ncbi:MAG: glycosyltransferase [Myxococcales bacterium]|nr:glycosyltransferase [Myxococcales bacterium]